MASVYKGGVPPADWSEIATGDGWATYVRPSGGDWFNVKVVSIHPRPRKANFWFGWNALEKRVADHRDVRIMVEHYPDLLRSVRAMLEALLTPDGTGTPSPSIEGEMSVPRALSVEMQCPVV